MFKDIVVYVSVLLFSVLFLVVGSRLMAVDTAALTNRPDRHHFSGVVTEIIDRVDETIGYGTDSAFTNTIITFGVRITGGERRGAEITARQHSSDFFPVRERDVSVGDRVVLIYHPGAGVYNFVNYVRVRYIVILGAIFSALVILCGRKKGFDAILALGITCLAIFLVFVPAILSGSNIYLATIIICVFSIVSTLLLVLGANRKSAAAILGCLGGVLAAGILMVIMDNVLGLTGVWDSGTLRLLRLPTESPINMSALIFAGVVLGALGAIMDVAMSIASSSWEVKQAWKFPQSYGVWKSGINIGKDLLNTSLGSLIMAYIGSTLSLIILIIAQNPSFSFIINGEAIIVEFIRALVGSFGMLLTIPLTAWVCEWLYVSPYDYYDYEGSVEELLDDMEKSERIESTNWGFYAGVLVLSVVFLLVGSWIAQRNITTVDPGQDFIYAGVVTEVVDRTEQGTLTNISFYVRLTGGGRRGEAVIAEQRLTGFFAVNAREVAAGNRVLLSYNDNLYSFANFARINRVVIFGILFFALVILFARKKGLNAIVALGFTCIAVFSIFVPAILSGNNIYVAAVIVCAFSIVSTLLIVNGPNKKALSAIIGCTGGVLFSGLIMLIMNFVLRMTGILDTETEVLLFLPLENVINLRAIIFAGVIIGAVGVIMDVAMSISSALWELMESGGVTDFGSFIKSGITVGRDLMGTMFSTLVLAYIGSSLTLILILMLNTTSYIELFNREMIIVEFLRALVGGIGMLLAIPLTALICGWMYAVRNVPPNQAIIDE